jgi:glycosyltransferase involved in cell wall biosynthesis
LKKVIFLITFSPKYDEYADKPKPTFNWTTPNGNWVGIWGYDWGDLLLKALVENYPDYLCEVWQCDLVADKIYSAQIHERLIHRNFPAFMINKCQPLRRMQEIYSSEIIEYVQKNDEPDTTFMLPTTDYSKWLNDFKVSTKKAKILYFSFINSGLMLPAKINTTNPLKYINRYLLNNKKKKWLKEIRNLLISNDNPVALEYIKLKYPKINSFYFHFGLDLDFWKPIISKTEARKTLDIPKDTFVIVLSNRLVPEYQIDRFIEVISKVNSNRKFLCYITGHGLKSYEDYLNSLVVKHNIQDKINFVGYIPDELLRLYFIAADLFAVVPIMFAGSNGALKAMAVGTPILHVAMGFSYEYLKSMQAGVYVQPTDYDEWVPIISKIVEGQPIKVPSREEIEKSFSWKRTAEFLSNALTNSVP